VRAGNRPDNSPQHSLKLNLSLPLPWPEMTAGIETQVISERLAANGAVRVDGYAVTNLNLNYSPATRAWQLAFGVYNLFDRKYADPVSVDPLADVPVYRMTQNARGYQLHGTVSF
jgi:iron complex outermembrane receptor protein